MKKKIRDSGLIEDVVVGGVAMNLAGSNLPNGFAQTAQIGIASKITEKAYKRGKLKLL